MEKFKNELMTRLNTMNPPPPAEFKQFVADYNGKRKSKKVVDPLQRCIAILISGEQCTRSKQHGKGFCGTHLKVGMSSSSTENIEKATSTVVEIWLQSIRGILYYIDDKNNVYKVEDIKLGKNNAYAKWEKDENSVYKIVDA